MQWTEQLMREPRASWAVALIAAYLAGCFSTGYYLVRWKTGLDIRKSGSGSSGARNVGRLLGRAGFLLTVLGDAGKGVGAVALAQCISAHAEVSLGALIAVVIGHLWPVQLRFQGGKGVATSLGGLAVFNPWLLTGWLVLFGLGFALSRKTVLSGLAAFLLLPAVACLRGLGAVQVCGVMVLSGLILAAHYSNLTEQLNQWLTRRALSPKPKSPA